MGLGRAGRGATSTAVMESLRGALVPGLPGQWRILCHPLSLPPAHARAGGCQHMNSRSVPAAQLCPGPAGRGSGSSECSTPRSGRDLRQQDGLGKGQQQPSCESIWGNARGRGNREGRAPGWGKYPPLLSFAPQLWQPISFENPVLLFSSAPLWRKTSGRMSAAFCQEQLWAFFQKNKGKKRDITKKRCFLGKEGQQRKRLAFSPQKEVARTLQAA